MKKRILALTLCLGLLPLGGCAAMLERGHVSSTDHVDYAVEEDSSILRAESYQGLVNSMLYFVDGHRSGGTIRLYNYAGDVEADLDAAREAVLHTPVGAYAVGSLELDSTRILTYYEVKLSIRYTHTAREVDAIPEVTGLSGVRQELERLAREGQSSTVFLASYFSGDRALVEQLLTLACVGAPELFHHHDIDVTDITLYPETGTRRVVEVKLGWSRSASTVAEEEKEYAQQLETAAAALLETSPAAGERHTVEELAAIVRSAADEPDDQGTPLALSALSGEPASDFGLLMAMEYLCRQCGIAAEPVEGAQGLWLIVSTPEGSRHLLAESLHPVPPGEDGEEPEEPEFQLYTDQELGALGYDWPESLYPVCTEPS